MGVEKNIESTSNQRDSVEKYCPPALRKSKELNELEQNHTSVKKTKNISNDKSECNSQTTEAVTTTSTSSTTSRPARRERRPDREVYVPRARRSQTAIPNQSNGISSTSSINFKNTEEKTNLSNHHHKRSRDNHKASIKTTEDDKKNVLISSPPTTSSTVETPASNILIPKSTIKINNCDNNKSVRLTSNHFSEDNSTKENTKNKTINSNSMKNCDSFDVKHNSIANSTNLRTTHVSNMNNTNKISSEKQKFVENSSMLRIEDANNRLTLKTDNETEELQRASKEINRSNRRIIKQTFNSDILEIPERKPPLNSSSMLVANNVGNSSEIKSVDPENDDWDSMFDENGECLDPKILEELTASVGKVQIETPKSDYSVYLTKQAILNDEEFPHVLEISNFPVEFKTQDLMMVFSTYKESGFDIKWVDDTHALAVFSSSRIAAEILAMNHPFVVLKPLAEATAESRSKAKKCATSLQPYRARPETCAALARRLVTGALGVRLKTDAQERENEKRVLREAKERKLLAAKQRDEVWES